MPKRLFRIKWNNKLSADIYLQEIRVKICSLFFLDNTKELHPNTLPVSFQLITRDFFQITIQESTQDLNKTNAFV